MVMFIKANGKIIKHTARVFSVTLKDHCMKVNGRMINKMEKELKPGTSELSNMKVSLKEARRLEKVNLSLKDAHMTEILLMENSMDKENIILQTLEKFIMVLLKIIN